MAYAHGRRVLHRDLKPGNIMLGKYGETLVVDWGLAKALDEPEPECTIERPELPLKPSSGSALEPTQVGSAVGTPGYMSPEQVDGRVGKLGVASDVYCLGATLYHVLTGHAPCEAEQRGEIYRKVLVGEIRRPRSLNPRIAPALEAICLKALALGPGNRYESAGSLRVDIERWLADEPVTAWREPWAVRARRWTRRNRTAVSGAAAAILVLMTVAVVGSAMYFQQRRVQANRLELALRDVNVLIGQAEADPQGDPARWHSAREAFKRAEDLLGPLIDAASRRRVKDLGERIATSAQAAERDAALLREAVDIRSAQEDDPDGSVSDSAYARAFREAKLDVDALGPNAVGVKIRARPTGCRWPWLRRWTTGLPSEARPGPRTSPAGRG